MSASSNVNAARSSDPSLSEAASRKTPSEIAASDRQPDLVRRDFVSSGCDAGADGARGAAVTTCWLLRGSEVNGHPDAAAARHRTARDSVGTSPARRQSATASVKKRATLARVATWYRAGSGASGLGGAASAP